MFTRTSVHWADRIVAMSNCKASSCSRAQRATGYAFANRRTIRKARLRTESEVFIVSPRLADAGSPGMFVQARVLGVQSIPAHVVRARLCQRREYFLKSGNLPALTRPGSPKVQ